MFKKSCLAGITSFLLLWLLVGCGVAHEEYDAVVAERDEAKARIAGLEAARRIAEYRDRVLKTKRRKEELETSLQRITRDTQSLEQTREALARLHLENVCNAAFKEKVRVIEILDVKVYPSENLDHIGVTCAVNLSGLEDEEKPFSCHNTNIASPKL